MGSSSNHVSASPANQPPELCLSPAVFRSVDENLLAGANVGNPITASDPEGNTIVYSITGSNPGGFTVNSSGQIQTGQVLNREETVSYTITLRADATGGHDTTEVTIQVTDVNEAPVVWPGQLLAVGGRERLQRDGPGRGPITADDPDGDTLNYSLSGTGSSDFTVTSSGQIRTAGTINYEAASSYTLTLTASDGTLSDTATINVTVNNLPEDAAPDRPGRSQRRISRARRRGSRPRWTNQDGMTTTVYFRLQDSARAAAPGSARAATAQRARRWRSYAERSDGWARSTASRRPSAARLPKSSGRQQVEFTTLADNSAPDFGAATLTRRIDEGSLSGQRRGRAGHRGGRRQPTR